MLVGALVATCTGVLITGATVAAPGLVLPLLPPLLLLPVLPPALVLLVLALG
jgi:hypothetical protein